MVTVITPTPRNQGFNQVAGAPTTDTDVSVTTSDTALLSANANRRLVIIVNTGSSHIRVRFGATATTGTGVQLRSNGGSMILDNVVPTTSVNAIAETATSVVSVTEY